VTAPPGHEPHGHTFDAAGRLRGGLLDGDGVKGLILSSKTPALDRSALVVKPRLRRTLAGTLCPGALLADAPDGRFTLVTGIDPSGATCRAAAQRGIVVRYECPGTPLHQWLRSGRTRAALIRPDGAVMCTGRELDTLINALP
jgi:3-(3-hydroxy-phenyl)propionate hydroxylase